MQAQCACAWHEKSWVKVGYILLCICQGQVDVRVINIFQKILFNKLVKFVMSIVDSSVSHTTLLASCYKCGKLLRYTSAIKIHVYADFEGSLIWKQPFYQSD